MQRLNFACAGHAGGLQSKGEANATSNGARSQEAACWRKRCWHMLCENGCNDFLVTLKIFAGKNHILSICLLAFLSCSDDVRITLKL